MLGILVGTDDGLLEVIPGAEPHVAFESGPITSIDYRDGVAIATGPDAGVWVHAGERWERSRDDGAIGVRVDLQRQLFVGGDPTQLHRSSDFGESWEELEGVRQVARHNRFPGTSDRAAPPCCGVAFPREGVLAALTGGGLWHTHDGGRSWTRRGDGLDPAVHQVREHPEQADRIFATAPSGFYRSEDAGFSWIQSLGGLDRSWAGSFAIVPGAPDRIILTVARHGPGVDGALFSSANGGVTWSRIALGDQDEWEMLPAVTRMWDSEDTLFVIAGGSIWASHDGGRNWMALVEGLPAGHAIAAAL